MELTTLPALDRDRPEIRRGLTLLGLFFVVVAMCSWLWLEAIWIYARSLGPSAVGSAFQLLMDSWITGMLGLGCAAAGLAAYRSHSVLVSGLFGIVAEGGYLAGASLMGVTYDWGFIEYLVLLGAMFGALGVLGGLLIARFTSASEPTESPPISRLQVLLILTSGVILGALIRPILSVITQLVV